MNSKLILKWFELLNKISNYEILKYLLMIQALLLSGILSIFYFQSQAFYAMSTPKLVLFALSITVPVFMINMIISSLLYKVLSDTIGVKFELLVISSGILTTLSVYLSVILGCFLKYNFSGFLKVLLIEETLAFIIILAQKLWQYVLKNRRKYIIQKHQRKHSDNDNERTHILGE